MAKVKYDDINLKVADKGFILSFVKISPKAGKTSTNQWENEVRDYQKEAYEDGTTAIARMTELAGLAKASGTDTKTVAEG